MRLEIARRAMLSSPLAFVGQLAERLLVAPVKRSTVMHSRNVVTLVASLASVTLIGAASPATEGAAGSDEGPSPVVLAAAAVRTVAAVVAVAPAPAVLEAMSACPEGSIEVEGDYCPRVDQKCLRWLDGETKMRCAEFAPTPACASRTVHKRFCIDAYEYPNQLGRKPVVMTTWQQAANSCQAEGKRLCTDSEWTLACEGQQRLPYPYGYSRSAEACNIDRPHPAANESLIANPHTRDAEVARLDQRDASGEHEACVSSYGVHDMTGNVDEWVVNESAEPFKSGLKGGYWGPVRDRCRPMTTAHNETFAFYQIGFRCCGNPSTDKNAAVERNAGPARPARTAALAGS